MGWCLLEGPFKKTYQSKYIQMMSLFRLILCTCKNPVHSYEMGLADEWLFQCDAI